MRIHLVEAVDDDFEVLAQQSRVDFRDRAGVTLQQPHERVFRVRTAPQDVRHLGGHPQEFPRISDIALGPDGHEQSVGIHIGDQHSPALVETGARHRHPLINGTGPVHEIQEVARRDLREVDRHRDVDRPHGVLGRDDSDRVGVGRNFHRRIDRVGVLHLLHDRHRVAGRGDSRPDRLHPVDLSHPHREHVGQFVA